MSMAKGTKIGKNARTGKFVSIGVAARERTLSRSSADYVFSGGKGKAAYDLAKVIEGAGKSRVFRDAKTGRLIPAK